MKKLNILIFLSFLFFIPPTARAANGLYVLEGLLPYYFKLNNGSTPLTERTFISSETSLGYIVGDWAYLGGVFNYTMVKDKTGSGSSETTHDQTLQYYGPVFGYMNDKWFVLLQYFANAEHKDVITPSSGTSSTTDRTGTGFGVNVGYKFQFIGGSEIAPVMAFKSINYVNCKDPNSGATSNCNPTVVQSEFTPYLTFLFNFK